MRNLNRMITPILTFFFSLLASFTILTLYLIGSGLAQEEEIISLYRRALEEMRGPIQLEDFQAIELRTSADYRDLAQLCIEGQRYRQALEALEEALDLDPFNPVANLQAGLAHYKLREYGEAAYHLEWALRAKKIRGPGPEGPLSDPTNPEINSGLPRADQSIRDLLNKAREKARDQEAEKASLETPPDIAQRPFPISSPFPSGQLRSQLEQLKSQGIQRTHGNLPGRIPFEEAQKRAKEATKALLGGNSRGEASFGSELSRTVYPPLKQGLRGVNLTEGHKGKESLLEALLAGKKTEQRDTNKEKEQEGKERFLLQPFNPGRK